MKRIRKRLSALGLRWNAMLASGVGEQHTPPLLPGRSTLDSWDRRWARNDYMPRFEIGTADVAVRQAVEEGWFQPGMRALDIGCGEGHNAAWLAGMGLDATGIDFAPSAIARSRAAHGDVPRLTFEAVDVTTAGIFRETFDVLIDRGCLHGIDGGMRPIYAANLARWSRANARLLLIMRNPGTLRRRARDGRRSVSWHSGDVAIAAARALLEPDFEFLTSQVVDMAGPTFPEPLPGVAIRFIRSR